MTFGADWGWGADHNESRKIFDRFADAGGTFIDTANLYTNGTSEKYVGEFIHGDRDHFVVATKYTLTPLRNQGDTTTVEPNGCGNSRKNMMHAVEASLRRLNTDFIDILYIHAWDYTTPVEEVVRGLDDLVRSGKVLYVLASDTPAYIVAEAITLAKQRGWASFAGIQAPYNLLRRDLEREIFPMAKHHGLAVLPWGLTQSGVLTGKFLDSGGGKARNTATRVNPDSLSLSESEVAAVEKVVSIADDVDRSPAQVAINWVRQQQRRAQVIPILGARSAEQLADNMACLDWSLTEEQLTELDALTAPDLGFPLSFLTRNPFVYGNTFDQIDDHRGEMPR
jgi:aryl-alcohol dehydrogenase-like predicted oxidoreductase